MHTALHRDGEECIRPRELWITYPIISFCTLRPAPTASRQPSSIRLRCRDFTFACFYFLNESKARDVYDSIKAWTCKLGRIEKLYAFTYQPQPPEKQVNSWDFYDPVKEWRRMGVGDPSRKNQWRISNINQDYSVKTGTISKSSMSDGYSSHPLIPRSSSFRTPYQISLSITPAVIAQEQGSPF